jgi:hypothetical protein
MTMRYEAPPSSPLPYPSIHNLLFHEPTNTGHRRRRRPLTSSSSSSAGVSDSTAVTDLPQVDTCCCDDLTMCASSSNSTTASSFSTSNSSFADSTKSYRSPTTHTSIPPHKLKSLNVRLYRRSRRPRAWLNPIDCPSKHSNVLDDLRYWIIDRPSWTLLASLVCFSFVVLLLLRSDMHFQQAHHIRLSGWLRLGTENLPSNNDAIHSKFTHYFPLPSPADIQLWDKATDSCTDMVASTNEINYTLVTQCSEDRLWMMEHHCARWRAKYFTFEDSSSNDNENESLFPPISVAVYTNQSSLLVHQYLVSELGCHSSSLTVQTFYTANGNASNTASLEAYPVNVLRNMALMAVRTTYVLYIDIDFWPSADLYDTLQLPAVRQVLYEDPYATLVVPAYMMLRQCNLVRNSVSNMFEDCPKENIPKMPLDQSHLFQLILRRQAGRFDPGNKGGHGSTRYADWIDQPRNEVLPIECISSNRYEPYLVFRFCPALANNHIIEDDESSTSIRLPPFQPVFTGYGKNKMTWILHLRQLGYTLYQLGKVFLIHYPHIDSPARMAWSVGTFTRSSVVSPTKTPITPAANLSSINFNTFLHRNHSIMSQKMLMIRRVLPNRTIHNSATTHTPLFLHPSTTTTTSAEQNQSNLVRILSPREETDQLFVEFRGWLQHNVPNRHRVPRCIDAMTDDDRLKLPGHADAGSGDDSENDDNA